MHVSFMTSQSSRTIWKVTGSPSRRWPRLHRARRFIAIQSEILKKILLTDRSTISILRTIHWQKNPSMTSLNQYKNRGYRTMRSSVRKKVFRTIPMNGLRCPNSWCLRQESSVLHGIWPWWGLRLTEKRMRNLSGHHCLKTSKKTCIIHLLSAHLWSFSKHKIIMCSSKKDRWSLPSSYTRVSMMTMTRKTIWNAFKSKWMKIGLTSWYRTKIRLLIRIATFKIQKIKAG